MPMCVGVLLIESQLALALYTQLVRFPNHVFFAKLLLAQTVSSYMLHYLMFDWDTVSYIRGFSGVRYLNNSIDFAIAGCLLLNSVFLHPADAILSVSMCACKVLLYFCKRFAMSDAKTLRTVLTANNLFPIIWLIWLINRH